MYLLEKKSRYALEKGGLFPQLLTINAEYFVVKF
jgi:hypothetical protein